MAAKHLTSPKATAPVTGSCRWTDANHLTITTEIKSETYLVIVWEERYVRLTKVDGQHYDIDLGAVSCDCADHTFRRRADGLCKHLKALQAAMKRRPQ